MKMKRMKKEEKQKRGSIYATDISCVQSDISNFGEHPGCWDCLARGKLPFNRPYSKCFVGRDQHREKNGGGSGGDGGESGEGSRHQSFGSSFQRFKSMAKSGCWVRNHHLLAALCQSLVPVRLDRLADLTTSEHS